jgi:hypothetical protein
LEGIPPKALISQWTLIKEFENNIIQIVLYQPPEQPAKTEETTVTKKKEQQERNQSTGIQRQDWTRKQT